MLYFAYGSNLHVGRMTSRVPSATFVAVAALPGRALRFHKRGRDGSGKCDAARTGSPADAVHGVVYALDPRQRPQLDRIEGLGRGYDAVRAAASTTTPAGSIEVFLYVAQREFVDDALAPFDWYRSFVLAGASQHGLPSDYVERIAAVRAIPDPDPVRAAREQALLER